MNEDENTNAYQDEPYVTVNNLPSPDAVPFGIASMLLAMVILLVVSTVYFAINRPSELAGCAQTNATIKANADSQKAQAEAQKANVEYQAACIRRDAEMRLAVLKACVDRGNLPVLINNNIDCKPSPR